MKTQLSKIDLVIKPIYPLVILVALFSMVLVPNFATARNFQNTLIQSCDLIIMACGMTLVILNGSIDFSISAIMSFASVVGASIMTRSGGLLGQYSWGYLVAILAMLAIGVIIGAINGFAVVKLKMPSFMTTMAVQLIFNGLAMVYTTSSSITDLPAAFLNIANGKFLLIPLPVWLSGVVIFCTYWLLAKTVFGKSLYAVGSNQKTSYISGINVKSVVFRIFIVNGILGALAGILVTARIGAGKPDIGNSAVLDTITAVAIGGTSLMGGTGGIIGTAAGALLITILNVSLGLLNVQPHYILIAKGAIVMTLALLDARKSMAETR